MPLSMQLALTRHDDDVLTIYEARSAEVGGGAAAAAARAAVECGGMLTKAPSCWRHSSRPWPLRADSPVRLLAALRTRDEPLSP